MDQFQSDIYGEAMDSLYLYNKHVSPISYDFWSRIRDRLDWVCDNWQRPDNGIWEFRGRQEDFVYSKVMNWVALDRAVSAIERFGLSGPVDRWRALRAQIHDEVCALGYDPKRETFTQSYGSVELDAATLLLPLVGFLPPGDPRVVGTVRAVERELIAADASRAKRKAVIDQHAATYILQGALDRLAQVAPG